MVSTPTPEINDRSSIEICVLPQLFGKSPDTAPTKWAVEQWCHKNLKGASVVVISRRHCWTIDRAYLRVTCATPEETRQVHEFFNFP